MSHAAPPSRPPLRLLVTLLLLLIGYGSLFPFDYVPHEPGWQDLALLFTEWPAQLSTSDVIGNVLLFLPLGLLIPAMSPRPAARFLWIAFAVGYAWLLQYLQFWYPSRVPSSSDAVFNAIGVLLGLLLAAAAASAARRLVAQVDRSSPLWPASLALMMLWVLYRWFPLVPTLDFDNIKTALKPLLLHPHWDAARVLHDTAAWLLWFWLARHNPLRRLAEPWFAALCALVILAAEPLFVGGAISLSNLLGLVAALLLAAVLSGRSAAAAWTLLVLLGTSLAVSGLAPFTFFEGSNGFLWLPFAGMLSGSMVLNTASLIEKCYLYGGTLLLLTYVGFGWKTSAVLLAFELATLEWLQLSLPGRTAEITDPLLAVLLAVCLKALLTLGGSAAGRQPPLAPRRVGPDLRRRHSSRR